MVFKIETAVAMMIAFGLSLSDTPAFGALVTTPDMTPGSTKQDCSRYNQMLIDERDKTPRDEETIAELQVDKASCHASNNANEKIMDCGSAEGDLKVAEDGFTAACGKADIVASVEGCGKALAKCDCLSADPDGETEQINPMCESAEVSSPRGFSRGDKAAAADKKRATEVANMCPMLSAVDLKELEAQERALAESIPGMKKEISAMEESLGEIKDQANKEMLDADAELTAAKKAHADEILQMQNEADMKGEQARTEVQQNQAQVAELKSQLLQLEFKTAAAQAELEEKNAKIDLGCYQQASQKVDQMQKEHIAKGKMPSGDFNAFMKNIGVSNRKQWQRVALTYYKYCINSSPTQALRNAAITEKGQKDIAIGLERDQITAAMKPLQEQINAFIGGDCNASAKPVVDNRTIVSAPCENARKLAIEKQTKESAFLDEVKTIAAKKTAAMQSGTTKAAAKKKAIAEAQQYMADETMRLKNLKELLAIKKAKAKPLPPKEELLAEARYKMGELVSASSRYVVCGKDSAALCGSGTTCFKALKFLEMVGAPVPEKLLPLSGINDVPTTRPTAPGSSIPVTPESQPDSGNNGAAEGNQNIPLGR